MLIMLMTLASNLVKLYKRTNNCPRTPSINIPSVYVINVNSLAKAHSKEQLLFDLLIYQIGIAIVSETKLKGKYSIVFSSLVGYRVHRRDRLGRWWWSGHLCLGSIQLSGSQHHQRHQTFELLWTFVKSPLKTFLVGALYHLPKYSYSKEEIYEFIETSLEELMCLYPDASVEEVVGRDGALVESITFNWRVVGSTPALAVT